MPDLNVVALTATIARAPELISKGELRVARLRIAVEGQRRNRKSGELEPRAHYFKLTVFGPPAEEAATLGAGRRVAASGQLSWSRYVDREGIEREGVEIITRDWVRPLTAIKAEPAAAEAAATNGVYQRGESAQDLPALPW